MTKDVYFHSVRLDKDKCKGCTNCIKGCPTEAIRVREGKAKIIDERCIDCGECIRVCPHHAKVAVTDTLSDISRFKYAIALPAPSLYGQFRDLEAVEEIIGGLLALGFSDVFEVAAGADMATAAIKIRISEKQKRPLISSACPAIVRLIQVRFPELIQNIVDVNSPMEIAARTAKERFAVAYQVEVSEIGAFFITPCPAKMTAIKNPLGDIDSAVDGAISIIEIYGAMTAHLHDEAKTDINQTFASAFGVGWANTGGEADALGVERFLAVDGIHNVIKVLEEIENNKMPDLEYLEALSCVGGCVGGPLVFENCYVAKNNIQRLFKKISMDKDINERYQFNEEEYKKTLFDAPIDPVTVGRLSNDIETAMAMMKEMEAIEARLPGLDCGACGSPTCKTMAEDIVRGFASETDCIYILRDRLKALTGQKGAHQDNRRNDE